MGDAAGRIGCATLTCILSRGRGLYHLCLEGCDMDGGTGDDELKMLCIFFISGRIAPLLNYLLHSLARSSLSLRYFPAFNRISSFLYRGLEDHR